MKTWTVRDAKARFDELMDACENEGPQLITRRGVNTAVIVPLPQWQRINHATPPTLKDLLLAKTNQFELDLPPRGRTCNNH